MALKVNGEIISEEAIRFELDRLVRFYSEHLPWEQVQKNMDVLRKRAREQAIGTRLLMMEARKMNFKVPPEEVDKRLNSLKADAGGEEAFQEALRRQNYTEEMVRYSIIMDKQLDMLIAQITADVRDPTEEEIRAFYEENRTDFVSQDRVQVQHILLRPASTSEADKATARSRLEEIRRRILDGADFADEAAAHSECPSGRRTGGSLGWVSRRTMVPEVDTVIFALKDGEVSGIVETPVGLHIFKRVAFEPGGPVEYPDVAEKIRSFLRHQRRGAAISAYVAEIRKKAVVEED